MQIICSTLITYKRFYSFYDYVPSFLGLDILFSLISIYTFHLIELISKNCLKYNGKQNGV